MFELLAASHSYLGEFHAASAGLMPTEARGNYLPEAPYLRETKTYLNYMHASESTLDSVLSRYQYGPFLFFVADFMSNYLS